MTGKLGVGLTVVKKVLGGNRSFQSREKVLSGYSVTCIRDVFSSPIVRTRGRVNPTGFIKDDGEETIRVAEECEKEAYLRDGVISAACSIMNSSVVISQPSSTDATDLCDHSRLGQIQLR